MSQRLYDSTRWVWCLLVLYSGPSWNPVRCVTVRSPPSNPSTIEAQAKFFQDFFSVQLSPYKIEFGHVCEDPNTWEQRYEKKDFKNHRDMGKVRWGDKKGGYGEHYWDLNHAGHTGDHGNDGYDDGSYHDRDSGDIYDEPSEQSPNYDTVHYDPDRASHLEDNSREKRAPKRNRVEKVEPKEESEEEEEKPQVRQRPSRKHKEQKEIVTEDDEEEVEDKNQGEYRKPVKQRRPQKQQEYDTEEPKPTKEKNQIILVVDEKEKEEKPVKYVQRQPEPKLFVPYEGGAGVRQHYQAEVAAAASVPRLFLEPATGHVVDRATGQAYVLQPIIRNPTYS